ncbi:MAG: hypothetical protein IAE91_04490 [Ignavibacteriaceae bacterium]|nr:hypothetical protein [Ignavibacteriaceae bacterium]
MKIYKSLLLIITVLIFAGCSDKPGSYAINDEFDIIKNNVKAVLGAEYDAENFNIIEQGYINDEKTEYQVKFTFDLNKPYLVFRHTGLPGELIFSKNNKEEWNCTFNSGNFQGLFNLFKSNYF